MLLNNLLEILATSEALKIGLTTETEQVTDLVAQQWTITMVFWWCTPAQ